jgi:hypothetical protein
LSVSFQELEDRIGKPLEQTRCPFGAAKEAEEKRKVLPQVGDRTIAKNWTTRCRSRLPRSGIIKEAAVPVWRLELRGEREVRKNPLSI